MAKEAEAQAQAGVRRERGWSRSGRLMIMVMSVRVLHVKSIMYDSTYDVLSSSIMFEYEI